ncbi:MAG: cell division protein ZapA [Alcaligenaceae bacterium]|nr:cell division protein ZapA [Alcaligenaceae bacterium]
MEHLEVTILDKELTLACEPSEKEKLLAAVKQANDLMTMIKSSGNMNNERVAFMACIQLASQLLSAESTDGPFQGVSYGDYKNKVDHINALLDNGINQLK